MLQLILKDTVTPCRSRMIARAVKSFLDMFVTSDVLFDIELVLTESCNNAALHAYQGLPGELEIKIEILENQRVDFQVRDWGKEFQCPWQLPEKSEESGRGIFIMRQVMHSFDYSRENNSNVFSFTKKIGPKQWKECR
ncbi:ATP-binding protein [Desulfonatronospira sp.]|uniref:ATP-binding protein n=1 Tax=Desulfonatronospira sp. TaxID=1962951 RepID=UPI0025B975E5|nr:ATP-binding protein [Desulfonatronospira sp.]